LLEYFAKKRELYGHDLCSYSAVQRIHYAEVRLAA